MPDLNEEHSWPQVAGLQYRGQKTDEILGAFMGKSAAKVRVPAGARLCRGGFGKSISDPVTAWWSYFEIPAGAMGANNDVGFATRAAFARTMGISIREVIRIFLAVSEDWNSLEYLVRIRLIQPVWAFYGIAGQQSRLNTGGSSFVKEGEGQGMTKNLPGHGCQLYLPFLNSKCYALEDALELKGIESGLIKPV